MAQKIRQSCKKIKYRLQNLQNCKIEGGWILKYGLRLFLLWNIIGDRIVNNEGWL